MTSIEFTIKEKRLEEIDSTLKEISEKDEINIKTVIDFRDEAREIVQDLNDFIHENFKQQAKQ